MKKENGKRCRNLGLWRNKARLYDARREVDSELEGSYGLYGGQQKTAIEVYTRRTRHEKLVEASAEVGECRGVESGEDGEIQEVAGNGGEVQAR